MTIRTPAPSDLQRWSEELARNPGSLSFLPLARAYRRNGRRDLALKACLRGLEHHPGHVEAHALLALLHLEAGERDRAADEWSIVLRLKPGNFEALRGMGFRYLEQNDLERARQHLERAALIHPSDKAVQEALRLLALRQEREGPSSPTGPPLPAQPRAEARLASPSVDQPREQVEESTWVRPRPPSGDDFPFEIVQPPAASTAAEGDVGEPLFLELDAVVEEGPAQRAPEAAAEPWAVAADPVSAPPDHATGEPSAAGATYGSPGQLFDDLLENSPLLGALLLDRRGLVLAGSIGRDVAGRANDLGAILGGAVDDAARTVAHLALGDWRVMLLETATSVVHVSPVRERGVLVVAASRDAPTGWVLRTAAHAADRATRFLEGGV